MKIESGKYYRTRDGRKVGPIGYNSYITNYGKFFSGETFWDEFGRLYQSTKETDYDLIAEWTEDDDLNAICDERQDGPFVREPETGTLADLDVKPGDVVEWFNTSVVNPMEVISASIITSGAFEGQVEAVLSGYGSGIFSVEQFRIISRASDTPKTWGEMTDAEKGELLLAWQRCDQLQYWDTDKKEWESTDIHPFEFEADAYRVKPEPVRETVTLYHGPNDRQAFTGYCRANDDVVITYTRTTDGKPDLDSIKMEEV